MTDDSDRRFALALDLIEAARNQHRPSGALFYSDVKEALNSIVGALHRKGVSCDHIVRLLRDCALSIEHDLMVEFEWNRDRKATADFGPPGEEESRPEGAV